MFEDLSWDVEEYAKQAYKTAGLSANAYMETVMGFSASLNQSLTASEGNIARAADLSNQIIIDMSDNANKMGTDISLIQNAYQGFAKQNYTMLDNLKLGYGGTKEEMQRLLKDAEKLSGIKYDISSFADIAEAIHVVQAEMGISGRTAEEVAQIYENTGRVVSEQLGTTAKEASTTITGSLNATKAAWTNLVAGLADENQDVGVLVDNLVDSSLIVVDNLLPRVEIVLGGIGQLIEKLLPVVVQKIPAIIQKILPGIVQTGVDVVQMLIDGIEENLPQLFKTAHEILNTLLEGIGDVFPVIEPLTEAVGFLIDNLDMVLAIIVPLTAAFVAWRVAVSIANIVNTLTNATKGMTAAQIAAELAQKLLNATMLANPFVLVTTLIAGLVAAIVYLWNTNEDFRTACIEIWNSITEAFSSAWNSLLKFINEIIPEMINDIKEWFSGLPDYFAEIGANIVDGIWNGISAGWDWLVSSVKNLASSLFGAAKDELDINSPSRKFKWLGEMCVAGWNEGSEDLFDTDTVTKDINATLSVAKAGVIGGGGGTGSGGLTQHIYVNKEVATPDEVARAIRVESRYGLIGGVAFE